MGSNIYDCVKTMRYNTVVITGAANGIGMQLAIILSKQCDSLVLIDLESPRVLEDVVDICLSNGCEVYFTSLDVTLEKELHSYLAQTLTNIGAVDLVIAAAGISPKVRDQQDSYDRNLLMETNYYGVANTFSFFLKNFVDAEVREIKFVAITSIASKVATHNSGYYSASKAALAKYIDALRLKYGDTKFEFHEIVCGFVDTRVNAGLKHAKGIMISDNRAAKLINRAIARKFKRIHSIPKFQNFPWFALSISPLALRNLFLSRLYKIIYKK